MSTEKEEEERDSSDGGDDERSVENNGASDVDEAPSSSEQGASTSSWWGGLANLNDLASSIRESVAPALEVVKRDLKEFATTVTNDSADAIRTAVSSLEVGDDSDSDNRDEGADEGTLQKSTSADFSGERLARELRQLRLNAATYLEEFTHDEKEAHKAWMGIKDTTRGESYRSMVRKVEGAPFEELEARLVPSAVSADVFWDRLGLRTFELRRLDEARRKVLEKSYSEEDSALAASWCADEGEKEKGALSVAAVGSASSHGDSQSDASWVQAAPASEAKGVPVNASVSAGGLALENNEEYGGDDDAVGDSGVNGAWDDPALSEELLDGLNVDDDAGGDWADWE